MREGLKQFARSVLVCAILSLGFVATASAQKIRVQGTVRSSEGVPIARVHVLQKESSIATTNDDGKFTANINPLLPLRFVAAEWEDATFEFQGEQLIEVTMKERVVSIDEVSVVAKAHLKKVAFEPTDIEVVGDYLHLRTRFRVPVSKFGSGARLVVQPVMHDVRLKDSVFMRAVVIEGNRYSVGDARMYGFRQDTSPLYHAVVPNTISSRSNVVSYHDSIMVKHNHRDYMARVQLSIENFNRMLYSDTIVIAQGTIEPLRFLDYDFVSREVTNPAYIPAPEFGIFNDKGSARINFKVGAAAIDADDAQSRAELATIIAKLQSIKDDSLLTIKGINIRGVASPEGVYLRNLELANARSKYILDKVIATLPEELLPIIKISHSSYVERWEVVAQMLEADSVARRDMLTEVLRRNPTSADARWAKIRGLALYRDVIKPQYLSALRRVEYSFDYSVFRTMTDSEIERAYVSNRKILSRYDFYRLLQMKCSDEQHALYVADALKSYPNFALAANDLAVRLIAADSVNCEVLKPFVHRDADGAILYNQAIMCIRDGNYTEAQRVVGMMPPSSDYDDIRSVVEALNGRYEDAYAAFSRRGGLNEVLILLAMKRNREAYDKVMALSGDEAKLLYVKAVCANRIENLGDAIAYMQRAVAKDASLRDVMRVDSDVSDLKELVN